MRDCTTALLTLKLHEASVPDLLLNVKYPLTLARVPFLVDGRTFVMVQYVPVVARHEWHQ